MVNSSSAKTLLPQVDGRALDFIKISAAVFMVIDHVNLIWLGGAEHGMFLVGRATFPLFCYALAVAFLKAGPEKAPGYALRKYMPRLLALAVVSEVVSLITRDTGLLNVIFTLALASGMAGLSYRLKDWQLVALCLLAVLLDEQYALWLGARHLLPEFGMSGIMLPAAIMMYMQGRKGGMLCILALVSIMNISSLVEVFTHLSAQVMSYVGLIWFSSTVLPWWVVHWAQRMSNEGRLLQKYALHIFYPGHLLALWGLLEISRWIERAS